MIDHRAARRIAYSVTELVLRKNKAYGSSFENCGEFLKLLYPNGIKPEQYGDTLLLARIFDKCMRIANNKDAFAESPYCDMLGYSLLGAAQDSRARKGKRR